MLRRLKTVPKISLASLEARVICFEEGPLAGADGLPGTAGGGAACEAGSQFLV